MNYPWTTHDLTMDDAWLTHGPSLKAYGQLMGDPWIKIRIPTEGQRAIHGLPMD